MNKLIDFLRTGKKKVLVTTHANPDVDAYASSLLMYATIKNNFPEHEVAISIETDSVPERLNFFSEISRIEKTNLDAKIKEFAPDVLIATDVTSVKGITKSNVTIDTLKENGIFLAAFDHHDIEDCGYDYYVNVRRLSGVEVVYFDFILANNLKLPEGWQELLLSGLLTDSERFYYYSPQIEDSLNVTAKLLKEGYVIKEITEKTTGYSLNQLKILSKLIENIIVESSSKYAYSSLTRKDYDDLVLGKVDGFQLKEIIRCFIDKFLNMMEGVDFVFLIKSSLESDTSYSGSIRSRWGTVNSLVFLKELGGGGYVDGGGFKLESDSLENAIQKVKQVIETNLVEAYNKRGS